MHGLINGEGKPGFPSEKDLIFFVAFCQDKLKLRYSTVKLYMAGIRNHFIKSIGRDPLLAENGTPFLQLPLILQSLKRMQPPMHMNRLPITVNILKGMCTSLERGVFGPQDDTMLLACITLAFFGFLRCGEFSVISEFDPSWNLSCNDVVWNAEDNSFILNLRKSKTDPFRQGIPIAYTPITGFPTICPVSRMRQYLKLRYGMPITHEGPLFVLNSKAMTRQVFISMMRTVLRKAGYNDEMYNGHSFRSGAATTCAIANVEDHLIKTLGRWSSSCYTRYIKTPREVIGRAHQAMALVSFPTIT